MHNKPQIGFIGLGIMGKPMASNLLRKGYSLGLFARRESTLTDFDTKRKSGDCQIYSSPSEMAKHCPIIISIVSDTPDVIEVLSGPEGVIQNVQSGSIVIDMSTISPQKTRELAEAFLKKGAFLLDAPVSGGELGAIDASLSIMVGGNEQAFQRALPIFQALGKNIVRVGESGAGQVAKACNQILVAQTMSAVAEAYLLAQSSGVDPAKVREALLGGFAYSKILEVHGQRMLDKNYQPGFKTKLHAKDLRIALASAVENDIDLPGSRLVDGYLQRLLEQELGELDSAAVAKIIGSG